MYKNLKKAPKKKFPKEAPIQYQRGYTEFYKLKFSLNQDVLIPRPETELLVDQVIKLHPHTLFDVGTGSGCIAISVAKNLPDARVLAVDISDKALAVAEKNAKFHKTGKQVIFMKNDLLTGIESAPDVIVANLPYIPTARLMHIDPMVADFEPRLALDGGEDGFDIYRKLFDQIAGMRQKPKAIICEIDDEQKDTAEKQAKLSFPDAWVQVEEDLAHKNRILMVSFEVPARALP
jgi:release factor glutamine methyltransferase